MWVDDLRARWAVTASFRGCCPTCGSRRVWRNGIRRRTASLFDGERTVFLDDIPVRRLRCGDCGARWSVPPDGVAVRGHYQPCVVARAVVRTVADAAARAAVAVEHACHRRTLDRWVARVAAVAEPAALGHALLVETQAPVLPAPVPVTRPSRSPRLAALGARAVAVLGLLEALASACGLEPPGLAHVARFVPASATPAAAKGGATSAT
jgi:hypothetical protein